MIKQKEWKNFASKDETRPHLHYGHVIDGKMYITDGHRALVLETDRVDSVVDVASGLQILGIELFEGGKKAIPEYNDSNSTMIETKIPEMFGFLKTTGKARHLTVYLSDDGTWSFAPLKTGESISTIAFNPIYFREIAGFHVEIRLRKGSPEISPEISPAYMKIDDSTEIIVMPKRF